MEIRYISKNDDRSEISNIYEQSWKFAYRNIIPQEYLDSIPTGKWAEKLDNPNRYSLIAIENGKIIGTVSFGKSRFNDFVDYGEIISIYFLPKYMGKGYGKILMKSAVEELLRLGYHDIFFWVLEKNTRARRFYEKFGFTVSENFLDDNIGGKYLKEIQYFYHID